MKRIYADIQRRLPAPYNTYHLAIFNKKGMLIEDLIPNIYRTSGQDKSRVWGKTDYAGLPWVENTSKPYSDRRTAKAALVYMAKPRTVL